jgi:hypothetical protein
MVKFHFVQGLRMQVNERLGKMRELRREKRASDRLARFETIAKIASYIVTPIAIAMTGWWVQSSVAEAGIKKDYVGMAMGILKDKSADTQLIAWASEVVRVNSPTPLSNELQEKIVRSTLAASHAGALLRFPKLDAKMMADPIPVPDFPIAALQKGKLSERQIFDLWLADYAKAKSNEIDLKYLQKVIRLIQASDDKYRQDLLDTQSKEIMKELAEKR